MNCSGHYGSLIERYYHINTGTPEVSTQACTMKSITKCSVMLKLVSAVKLVSFPNEMISNSLCLKLIIYSKSYMNMLFFFFGNIGMHVVMPWEDNINLICHLTLQAICNQLQYLKYTKNCSNIKLMFLLYKVRTYSFTNNSIQQNLNM